jgi:hypothetical protein
MIDNPGNNIDTIRYLTEQLDSYPALRERILRAFLIALHNSNIITVDDMYEQARNDVRQRVEETSTVRDDNVQIATRWDQEEKEAIQKLTIAYVAQSLSRDDIDDIVNLTRKREEAQSISEIAVLPSVSFRLLAKRVKSFCMLPVGQTILEPHEAMSARVALIRYFISDQLQFIGVAKNHILIRDFEPLVDRMIGDDQGMGQIGGKAAGLNLASRILKDAQKEAPSSDVTLSVPDSYFLRSDMLEKFLQHNGLGYLRDQKYKDIDDIIKEYPMIMTVFKNANFPPVVVERLRTMLETVEDAPLIVRSSSLLEDRFKTAFAGKYRSVFVSNQGTVDERLAELLGAIAEVYASIYHPDPISYRKNHNLLDYRENMSVLIQKIVGTRCGDYFLPTWSGVAFSRNLFRRNPRVLPEDGLARLVLGLGTRAVDRVASDFPRVIPLGIPTLRPEVRVDDMVRCSQRSVDVINLAKKTYETVAVADVLRQEAPPQVADIISMFQHGSLRPAMGMMMGDPADAVVTFDRFTQNSPYPAYLRWMLQTLEKAYGCPVDIEVAHDGKKLYLLQCRPQPVGSHVKPVQIPKTVKPADRLFFANRDIMSGSVRDVEYVVLIDPLDYNALDSDQKRLDVAQIVHKLGGQLKDKRFILMGPGRWGSKDPRMGIKVGYSAISHTQMLIEIGRPNQGFVLEASFGSHFFQDLVESNIQYLALYPDDDPDNYNEGFLLANSNFLTKILPEFAAFKDVVRVIHVPDVAGGRLLNVAMDGERQEALGYLAG